MRVGDMYPVSQIKIAIGIKPKFSQILHILSHRNTDCHEEILVHCSNSLPCNYKPICIDTIIQHCFNISIFLPWPCWMLFSGKRSWLPTVHCREAKKINFLTPQASCNVRENPSPGKQPATCSRCAGTPTTPQSMSIDYNSYAFPSDQDHTNAETKPETQPSKSYLGLLLTAKVMSDMPPQADLPCKNTLERNQMEGSNKFLESWNDLGWKGP